MLRDTRCLLFISQHLVLFGLFCHVVCVAVGYVERARGSVCIVWETARLVSVWLVVDGCHVWVHSLDVGLSG